jgi:hypothetical protein
LSPPVFPRPGFGPGISEPLSVVAGHAVESRIGFSSTRQN